MKEGKKEGKKEERRRERGRKRDRKRKEGRKGRKERKDGKEGRKRKEKRKCNHQYDDVWRWGFWEMLGHEGLAFMSVIYALKKKFKEISTPLSYGDTARNHCI
jgi:hypothetical protein